ncbi:MAG: hypothetical protein HLX51_00725 [Micrococcaceae bacterium]|nr:hypothetical protein [Micrococcaceae bacterium]
MSENQKPRLRARRNPKVMRAWLQDEASQDHVQQLAQRIAKDLLKGVEQALTELLDTDPVEPKKVIFEVPETLVATRLAKAVQDNIAHQVGAVASAARGEQWPLSAIAEALSMEPSSDPRVLYPNIENARR